MLTFGLSAARLTQADRGAYMGKVEIEDLEQVAEILGDGGPHNADTIFVTVEDVVDDLVELGNDEKVFVKHDDHLGLKSDLSKEFLETRLEELDQEKIEKFEKEIEKVVEQAKIIIPLSKRELSEDDIEEINEDKLYRGESVDD